MKAKKILTALLAAAFVFTCGCTRSDTETAETAADTSETLADEEIAALDEHQTILNNSFVQFGNTYRIIKKLQQMMSGEETTIAYIGGSITYGVGADAETCYAKRSFDYLAEEYGKGDNVKYINAGISGTPSILGNLRVKRDVLDYDADIVFIEFAVNDGGEKLYQESYDSMVHTILEQENEPAVILLFNRTKEGHSAQDYMKQIGEYYELPMVSSADALTIELDAGRMTWDDYSNDSSHPNAEGHKLVAEMLDNYFKTLKFRSFVDPEYKLKPMGKFNAPYKNAVLAEADYDNSDEHIQITDIGPFDKAAQGTFGFTKGWAYDPDSEGGSFKATVTGNSLFLICKRNKSDAMGKIEVYIDGQRAKIIDTNDADGWGDPYAYQVIKWQSVKTMEVEVRIAEGSEDKTVEILGIAASANETF